MAKLRLADTWLSAVTDAGDYSDTIESCLKVRVAKTGAKTFSAVRKLSGKTVRVRIGAYPEIGLREARARAGADAIRAGRGSGRCRVRNTQVSSTGLFVSIHAPVKGATRLPMRSEWGGSGFDPRPREGGDAALACLLAPIAVSIHAPVKGATSRPLR